jgi:hypothetical protein
MTIRPAFPTRLVLLALVLCLPVGVASFAAEPEGSTTGGDRAASSLPGGIEVWADQFQETEAGEVILEGSVTVAWRGSKFQADRVVFREQRFIEAEGNVLAVWGTNRISGSRMTYDTKLDQGAIEDAMGFVEPEFFVTAGKLEKIGEDRVKLESANVTTCTQPVPYWSFSVSTAKIKSEGYARMWNVRLKAGKVPVFYLPFMVWPVKQDRSVGLLLPDFGSTEERGNVISQALFIPIGDSADVTLVGEYYTQAGFGAGGDFRFVPNRSGAGILSGFYINDKVAGPAVCDSPPCSRWRASYKQTQQFLNGFRMVADINQISDFNYFSDFERDIRLVSSPSIQARLEFTRNGAWTSVNIRNFRREQIVFTGSGNDTLVQQTLPEVELRGRNRQLGKSPFNLSYLSSLAAIQQSGPNVDADYYRIDLFPTVSVPLSRLPWLEVNPTFAYRLTAYSQTDGDPGLGVSGVNDALVRGVGGGSIDIVGPKISRVYDREGKNTKVKNLIEPRVAYAFREAFDETDRVIRYDEVDLIAPENLLTYGIRSVWFVKRPRAEAPAPLGSGESIMWPSGDSSSPTEAEPFPVLEPQALPEPPGADSGPAEESLEIASLELVQRRSMDNIITCADLDGDGVGERTSNSSPVTLTGRYNPSRSMSFDLRANWHPIYRQIQNVSLSGSARSRLFRAGFSVVHTEGKACSIGGQFLSVDLADDTQLALDTGFVLLGGKLRLDLAGSFTANPGKDPTTNATLSRFPQKRYRAEYYTQCCGFLAEYFERDYTTTRRQEFRFTIDLRGIGKFLDVHHGQE